MSATFLGAGPQTKATRAIIAGAPVATPYPGRVPHATGSPAAIRAASQRLARFVGHHDFDTGSPFAAWLHRVADVGDVPTDPSDAAGNRARIETAVAAIVSDGAIPILLGGDDSVAVPFVAAWVDQPPITVVQLDAHLDYRDEVDGEPFGYSSPMRRASEQASVRRIIHVGQRGVGSARPSDVQDSLAAGNTIVTARELALEGPRTTADRLSPGEPFVIVLDVDGIDPGDIPAVRAPVASGPDIAAISDLLVALAGRGSWRGLVVTEFEPDLDPNGDSALILARLITRSLDAGLGQTV